MPEFLWRIDESPSRQALLAPLALAALGYGAGARVHRWLLAGCARQRQIFIGFSGCA